jgi:hypothetical protein
LTLNARVRRRAAGEPVRVRVNRGERDGPGGVAAAVRGGAGRLRVR